MNPILDITKQGQSIWYDYIQRALIWTGALYKMMKEDGLKGVTSNPAIFEKAIGQSKDYQAAVKGVVRSGSSTVQTFERVAIHDIQLATDVLHQVYEETGGRDGYVSFEVSPHLAQDTEATSKDAKRLWDQISRDNLMIKIPATPEGLPSIERAIADGINVNITLLFAVEAYERVHEAYMSGLEKLIQKGGDPSRVASVASFFVSRIDSLVDKMIDDRLPKATSEDQKRKLESLRGKVAIANAKVAYHSYLKTIETPRWKALAAKGARTQRLLWASTGTKNPAYRDVLYVEELIGRDTVNTVPEATYNAFKDHGKVRASLTENVGEAQRIMASLSEVDISMKAVTDKLLVDGVILFKEAFDRLMNAVEKRRKEILGS
jgi:transaldolase/glucose-6-phosphate isomerase